MQGISLSLFPQTQITVRRINIARCLGYILSLIAAVAVTINVHADSINSPNITLNVDTNRGTGPGAGNVSVLLNTITVAEISLAEYSSGTGKAITMQANEGYQFDPASNVSIRSATIGFNGAAVNTDAIITPNGTANEVLTFNFTTGTNANVQDIIRINGVAVRILNAAGAAGPAQTTLNITTSAAGGAFTNQGIVAASITRGAADRLEFATEPGSNEAGADLFPEVKIVDFGGNLITNDPRTISLSIETNPGSATLLGNTEVDSDGGIASWDDTDQLRITTAASGYTLQASHSGAPFLTSDTVTSTAFEISAGNPGALVVSAEPSDTAAGDDIILSVMTVDEFDNPTNVSGIEVTLDSAGNPGGWPLLVDTSLTKSTVNGVVSWTADDHLRILKATTDYELTISGLGEATITEPFDIVPGAAALLRFLEQPSNVTAGEPFETPVQIEITDLFGNRVTESTLVELAANSEECSSSIEDSSAQTVSGIATFSDLSISDPCAEQALLASTEGAVGAVSDNFAVQAANAAPLAVKNMQLRRKKLFRFSARGEFSLPSENEDNPVLSGALLNVVGNTGTAQYKLPKSGWRKIGTSEFQFNGKRCQSVRITKKTVSAVCRGRTGSIALPESTLDVTLVLGTGTARFCGSCGGTEKGNASKIFKRVDCDAPELCL